MPERASSDYGDADDFESVAYRSGWFASVEETPTHGDVHLDIKIELNEWKQERSWLILFPLGTLLALPYVVWEKYTLQATARRRDGVEASYRFETGRVAVIWWAVLPLTPLMWDFPLPPTYHEFFQSLMRHQLMGLRSDGLLDRPG